MKKVNGRIIRWMMIPSAKQNSFSVLSHPRKKIVSVKKTKIVVRGVKKMNKWQEKGGNTI